MKLSLKDLFTFFDVLSFRFTSTTSTAMRHYFLGKLITTEGKEFLTLMLKHSLKSDSF